MTEQNRTNGHLGQSSLDRKSRFAQLSGAVIVRVPEQDESLAAHQQLLESPEPIVESEKKTFLSEESALNKSIPFHRDKRVKLVALIVSGFCLTGIAAFLATSSFRLPKFQTDKPKPVVPRKGNGHLQETALSNTFAGFKGEADRVPFNPSQKKSKPLSKVAPAKPNTAFKKRATPPVVTTASTVPLRRTVLRSYIPPDNPPMGRRSFKPVPVPVRSNIRQTVPPVLKPSPSKPAVRQEEEKSPEERRLAAIAATTAYTQKQEGAQTQVSSAGGSTKPSGEYQDAEYLASESAVIDDIPQHLVGRGQQAKGRLMTGFVFLPGDVDLLKGQTVDIEITDSMQTGLPAGSRIVAEIDLPQSGGQLTSAPFRLKPVGIAIGDAEYPLPQNTIRLSGSKGKPLVAKRQGSAFLRFLGGLAQSLVGGAGSLFTGSLGNNSVISTVAPQVLNDLTGKSGGQQQATEVLAVREDAPIQVDLMAPLSLPAEIVSQSATPSLSGPETIPESPQPAVLAPKPELTSQSLPESVAQDPGFGSTSQPPSEPVFPQSEDQQVALTDQQIDEVIQGEINNAAIPEAVQFQQISQPAESTSIEAVDQPIP
jgi:hypothetical protein